MPPKKAPVSTQPKKKKKSILWDRDGVNGGSSSIELVIQWLITGDNYEQWESSIESPKVCIRQKIADLQRSYNNACDFIKNTGEGILAENEADGIHTVQHQSRNHSTSARLLVAINQDERMETEEGIMNTAQSDGPPVPNNTIQLIQSLHDDSDGSELLDVQLYRPSPAPIPQASSAGPDLYMKSIVSKRQAEVTRARADASKVKVAYTKELREHGLPLEEIKRKAAAEFPPLADMDHDKSDESENDSDDSA
ncbi:hypothetical protein PSHT_05465 [Puccinia striiformis]|uniref:Uncharacterized protein n=1 Tax=Puccinia striiformis TaxID=27350 RepID=A0A2S4WAA8_9BASI|nr:hypothetical protein PSHT_05465 [Puccinia striiformis]